MLAGIDFSTRAIHAALIPLEHGNGEPHVAFRHIAIPKSPNPLDRYYQARLAMRTLCQDEKGYPIHLVVVEQPMGRFGVRPLWGMFGAIVASVPGIAAVTALDPQTWRRELGLPPRMTKEQAIAEAAMLLGLGGLDEHSAEALLIALAGRQINNRAWSEGAA